jgi:hypothetical protein
MQLKVGARLFSAVGKAQFVVVRAPQAELEITCGGHPLETQPSATSVEHAVVAGHEGETLLGKRYADAASAVELLCTKAGDGALSLAGTVMPVKSAKALPASD